MTDKKTPKKPSTGPVTVAGKSRSAMNALRHGTRSAKLLLPTENEADFALLLSQIAMDLRPVGAMEHILVDKIVAVLWRKQRLDGAEHATLSSAQMQNVSDQELKAALGFDLLASTKRRIGNIDITERTRSLPTSMLDESNAPSELDGAKAVAICDEWTMHKEEGVEAECEADAITKFPENWSALQEDMRTEKFDGTVQDYLDTYYKAESFYQGFHSFMHEQQEKSYVNAYWHKNREKMAAAFRAIRVKKMLGGWDLDRSHRYHTMLDNQLFKLMREFREIRSWRLSNLEIADTVEEKGPRRD